MCIQLCCFRFSPTWIVLVPFSYPIAFWDSSRCALGIEQQQSTHSWNLDTRLSAPTMRALSAIQPELPDSDQFKVIRKIQKLDRNETQPSPC